MSHTKRTTSSTKRIRPVEQRTQTSTNGAHVITAHDRERSILATSPDTLRVMQERRGTPLLVSQDVKLFGMHTLSKRDLFDLRIDTRYQREEITLEVNELIHVLKSGGMIPDPITVAERLYGDHKRYIVDGQQRWWAHVDTETPIKAIIYRVTSYEQEVQLFQALNMAKRLSPAKRVESWPRAAGRVLHGLNNDVNSPLHDRIRFGNVNDATFNAIPLLRGLTTVISNRSPASGVDALLKQFDRHYDTAPAQNDLLILQYARLVANVFHDSGKHRLRQVPAIALGKMGFAAWHTKSAHDMRLPSTAQIARMRAMNWTALTPTSSTVWLPTVLSQLQMIWPVQLVAESGDAE